MRHQKNPLFRPPPRFAIGPEERKAILECIRHYRQLGLDPGYDGYFEELFTTSFAEFMGGGYSDAVSSGCASLYIALKSLRLAPKSLVATSPVTDASIVGCIVELGHVPYLIDSAPGSYNITLKSIEARWNKDIRALVITHSGGEPCDILPIKAFCDKNNAQLIEDCSQAIGAIPLGGQAPVGAYGRFGCFSTMYRKNLSALGSSGLVFCKDFDDFKLAKQYADRGKRWWDKESVDMRDPGFADFPALNWNSDEIRCAVGLANLNRLEDTNRRRREFVSSLIDDFTKLEIKLFRPYNFHNGFAPFYFPIFINEEFSKKSVLEISEEVRDLGLGIGIRYGCIVSTWNWARPFMFDEFSADNAASTRDQCFHLYLNENYKLTHAKKIARLLKQYETQHLKDGSLK